MILLLLSKFIGLNEGF